MADNIYQTIMNAESGGKNVPNYMYDSTHTASGYFQITNSTWATTQAGQNSGVTRAMDAPYATQQAAAGELIQRNGLNDWAPYDHINPNVSNYDTTPLSGPNGNPVTTPSAAAAPATDAASGGYTLSNPYPQYDSSGNLITNPTATVQDAGQNGTATSGNNPAGDVLNPSAVPIAITTTGKLAADTAAADTKSATGTATTIYGSIFTGLADSFGRIAFFVIGLILLAGGLWIIASEESGGAVPGPVETFRRGKTLFA